MDVQAALAQAIDEILDKMAFLYLDEAEPGELPDTFDHYTQTTFVGPGRGTLTICFSQALAAQMARNLIGIRDEDELFEGTLEDAIREFTNMVVGRTLTLLSPEQAFELTVPTMVQAVAAPGDKEASYTVMGLLEDEPFMAVMRVA
jgi:CheY-specific phosphatase CheX